MNESRLNEQSFRRFAVVQNPIGRWWLLVRLRWAAARWQFGAASTHLVKRTLDLFVSASALLLLSPVIGVIALLVKSDGGPVLFRQRRVGYAGRELVMLKFRSMAVDAEKRLAEVMKLNEKASGITFKMKNDPRVTPVGRILRKTSLDELPQLWNVLRGEMSLVGPRPALPREVAMYDLQDRNRLFAKPGLTCFWQVGERNRGVFEIGNRNEIDFPEQVRLDVRYIEEQSLLHDLRILLKTIPAVLFGS
jgi:lipopolysaccharide/colanic/teichoic acid biosynthesis glycosyltransferase